MRLCVKASRGGATSPLGKFDDAIKGCRIEGEIKRRFNARAAAIAKAAGIQPKPEAELVRDAIRVAALGEEEAVRMYGEGVLVVARMIGKAGTTHG